MAFALALACAACLLFMPGCAFPAGEEKPTVTHAPTAPPPAPPAERNETVVKEGAKEGGERQEDAKKNESSAPQSLPEQDEFAGIVPRNISENIGDGEFRVHYQPATPLQVYVISGGNADSILVRKGEFSMLVDAGNATAVREIFETLRIGRVNVVVATKNSPDAIGGLAETIRKYGADELWTNGIAPSGMLAEAVGEARKKGIFLKQPQAGDRMEVNGLLVEVLNPQQQRLYGSPESDAIVLKLTFNSFCMLLLNPATQEIEPALLSSGISPRCDVLTYFNHGEGRPNPSALLEQAQPQHAIISVGENGFGLPSATTLTRLGMKGIGVYRTDLNGTVVVSTDGLKTYDIGYLRK
ncbi:MAG: hypothetical protein N3E51_03135 [Candidatus Micrarchaeota archaeon]|nr:hypothetical protein [Candidatus Micrarchaeota archaeon]